MIRKIYTSDIKSRREILKSHLAALQIQFETQAFSLEGYEGENLLISQWHRRSSPYVAITAHYDGWGAYDNVGGTVALLWLLHYIKTFAGMPINGIPGLMIVFVDGEELGLLGARSMFPFLSASVSGQCVGHISLDGFGIGSHICGFANTRRVGLCSSSSKEIDFVLQADTSVFQDNAIKSLHLFTLPEEDSRALHDHRRFPTSWRIIHTSEDTPDKLDEAMLPFVVSNLYKQLPTVDFNANGLIRL